MERNRHDADAMALISSDERLEAVERPGRPECQFLRDLVDRCNARGAIGRGGGGAAPGAREALQLRRFGAGDGHTDLAARAERRRVMHRTETLDYMIVLSGECDLELDDGLTTHVSTGDIVVQRGTMHAWVNNGSAPRVFAFVLTRQSSGTRSCALPRPVSDLRSRLEREHHEDVTEEVVLSRGDAGAWTVPIVVAAQQGGAP